MWLHRDGSRGEWEFCCLIPLKAVVWPWARTNASWNLAQLISMIYVSVGSCFTNSLLRGAQCSWVKLLPAVRQLQGCKNRRGKVKKNSNWEREKHRWKEGRLDFKHGAVPKEALHRASLRGSLPTNTEPEILLGKAPSWWQACAARDRTDKSSLWSKTKHLLSASLNTTGPHSTKCYQGTIQMLPSTRI